jgi:predicted  nucleic acid-binding Zn-ribbon protein
VISEDHHEMSFVKRYHASHEVAIDRLRLENDVLQYKKNMQTKDNEINKNKKEVRDKVIKISELEEKLEGLTEELQSWEQKKEREEREKMMAIEKERKMKEEMLIKNGIIGSNGKSLCF